MVFEANLSLLYSDSLIPDVFISEYMPSLESDFVKVYIYCVFISKHKINLSADEIAKKLELQPERVREAINRLEELCLISRGADDNVITLTDLKEREIKKLYRMKNTSSPDDAVCSSERSKKRSKFISSINNAFFQGLMSPSWYTDIDAWLSCMPSSNTAPTIRAFRASILPRWPTAGTARTLKTALIWTGIPWKPRRSRISAAR